MTVAPLEGTVLTSSPALGVVALGLPAAVLLLAVIWARPGIAAALRAAASFAVLAAGVGLTALAVRPPAPSAAGAPPTPTATLPPASCSPDGGVLRVAAIGFAFQPDCLAAHAGEPFRIAFANEDEGVQHNVAVYEDAAGTGALFVGDPVAGPGEATYRVDALDAGTYLFRCDFHPQQMRGVLVVA